MLVRGVFGFQVLFAPFPSVLARDAAPSLGICLYSRPEEWDPNRIKDEDWPVTSPGYFLQDNYISKVAPWKPLLLSPTSLGPRHSLATGTSAVWPVPTQTSDTEGASETPSLEVPAPDMTFLNSFPVLKPTLKIETVNVFA